MFVLVAGRVTFSVVVLAATPSAEVRRMNAYVTPLLIADPSLVHPVPADIAVVASQSLTTIRPRLPVTGGRMPAPAACRAVPCRRAGRPARRSARCRTARPRRRAGGTRPPRIQPGRLGRCRRGTGLHPAHALPAGLDAVLVLRVAAVHRPCDPAGLAQRGGVHSARLRRGPLRSHDPLAEPAL